MSKLPIGILVVADGIDESVVARFKDSIHKSEPETKYRILVKGRVGQARPDGESFHKTGNMNRGLEELIPECEVIIQTDIDLLIPPGLIDKAYRFSMNNDDKMYHHVLRYIDPEKIEGLTYNEYPWDEWKKLKYKFCSGCFNAMPSKLWDRSGGYNEGMVDWGNEDTEFYKRCCHHYKIGLSNNTNFPLVHVNHPRRTPNRVKENVQIGDNTKQNKRWIYPNVK